MDSNTISLSTLVVLPSFGAYQDRFRMFAALADRGVRTHLHLHNPGVFAEEPDVEVTMPATSDRRAKWRTLRQVTGRFAEQPGRLIVHDLFVPRAARFLRRRWTFARRPAVRNVLSFYSPNAVYLFEGRWRRSHGDAMTLGKTPGALSMALKRAAWEWGGVRLVDGITGNCDEIVAGAQRYYGLRDRQAAVIPTAVDTRFWCPVESADAAQPRPAGDFLFVGRLVKRKGLGTILEAMSALQATRPDFRLVAVGSADSETGRRWFDDMVADLGLGERVQYLGEVDRNRLRELYRKATALVLPSLHEGSPRTVKEAAACGCPVITSRIPGTTLIDPTGEFFRFCEPGDVESLTQCIDKLLGSCELRNRVGALGRQRMVETFSPAVVAQRTAAFYEQLHGI